MARIIEARAVISAEDRTGAVFDKIAKKFDGLAKSTKAAENVNRLTNSLRHAETQLRAIDKFNTSRGLFSDARSRFREAQEGIQRTARAIASAEKPTRALELAHRRAEAAVKSASRAFDEQKVAVLSAKRALETSGAPLGRLAHEQARLRTVVERTNRALHQQNQIALSSPSFAVAKRAARGGMHGATRAIGETGAIYGAAHAAKHAIKEGADLQHERVRMQAGGMSPDEIEAAETEAGKLSKKYRPVGQTQIMHLLRNTRSVVGSYSEAAEIADPLLALRVVAMGAHPDKSDELNEDFDNLVKGMEIKGVTQDHGKFRHYIDGMAKAVNVFGDTLRPTDFYEMFKYGRASTTALSDDFMLNTAPTLAQELKGSSTGKALSSFYTQFVGGKMSNKAVEQLQKYGMLDPSKVIKTKTGNVKGVMPGGIVGGEYLKPGKTDPYRWVNEVLLPHLASKGVTDPAEIQEAIAAMSSQSTTAQMLSIFATQQARIEKDKALVHGAKGIEAAPLFMKQDPKVGTKSIIAQSNNILQNATSPAMKNVAPVLDSVASGLATLAQASKNHPWLSTIATGGVAAGGVAGGLTAGSHVLPALLGSLPEGGLAAALGGTAVTAAKWAARGSGWTTAVLLAWEAYQNRDEIGKNALGMGDHPVSGDPWKRKYDLDHPTDTLDRLRQERDERNAQRPSGGRISSDLVQAPIKTELTGSAEVRGETTIKVEVTASSELLRAVEGAREAKAAMTGRLNANGPGSVGHTSPDAGAAGQSGGW